MATIVKMMANSSVVLITTCNEGVIVSNKVSLINNRMVGKALAPETFKVRSKGWNWSMGSIQDP